MFKQGEVIRYGQAGVCRIQEKKEMDLGGDAREYYVLYPLYQSGSLVYVPSDNEKLMGKICPLMTRQEAEEVFCYFATKEAEWIRDFRRRSEFAKETLGGNDRLALACLIKMILTHREEGGQDGKRVYTTDDYYLKDAQALLYWELAHVLGEEYESILQRAKAALAASK